MRDAAGPGVPSPLLSALFEAASKPALWPDTVLRIGEWLGGSKAALQARALQGRLQPRIICPEMEDRYLKDYVTHYYRHDPHLIHLAQLPLGRALLSRDVLPDRELFASAFYNEHCRPQQLADLQGALLLRTPQWGVTFAIYSRADRRFEPDDLARLNALVPDLSRALSLAFRWDGEVGDQALNTAVGMGLLATLRVDRSLRVLDEPDERCERVLDREDASLICERHELRARCPEDQLRLLAAVAAASAGTSSLLTLGPNARALLIGVAPGPRDSPLEVEHSVTLVFAPASRDRKRLLRGYVAQLPPSLQAVAECLSEGLSDKETADKLGLPLSTARTYVARVLSRLGVHNRRELMRAQNQRTGPQL